VSANPKNLSPKQRAEVQRQIARAYRAWRKRYGEPTPKEREAIVAIGFKEARKSMRSIPTAANPSLVASAIGGVTGALVANALGNPVEPPEWPSEIYRGRERVRGWTVPVSPTSADYLTGGRLVRRRLPHKTKQEHIAIGDAHARAGLAADVAHREMVDLELATLQARRIDPGPLISGIVSGHFPEDIKFRLRTLAHESSERKSAAMAHYAAAGLRHHTALARLRSTRPNANPLVTMPAAPFMEIGPAAALPLNENGRGPWVIVNLDEQRVVSELIASRPAAQDRIESALERARVGGGAFPRLSIVTLREAKAAKLEIPGEESVDLHKSRKACPTCGSALSLMATLDKTRFWWECPAGHKTQLNPQSNPLLMTVLGANPLTRSESGAIRQEMQASLADGRRASQGPHPNYSMASWYNGVASGLRRTVDRYGANPGPLSEARATLAALGMSLTHSAETGEYRVNYRGGKESTAYYTNDLADAVATGTAMASDAASRYDLNPGHNSEDTLYCERSGGRWECWAYSDGQRVYVTKCASLGDCRAYADRHQYKLVVLRDWEKNPYAGGPTVDESPRIARLRDIAASGVDTEFEGVSLDPESASVLVQVHDALPVASRARFARLPLPRMGNIAMQAMTKRRSANPSLSFEHPEGVSKPEFHSSVTGGARRLSMVTPTPSMQMWPVHPAKGLEVGVYDERTGKWGHHYGSSAIARDVYGLNPGENPRAVHESIVSAFFDRQARRIGERYSTDGQALRVWGNLVAEWRPEGLYITDAGWRTMLTRNVLNQILVEAFRRGRPSGQIYQKKFGWYFEPITHPEGRRLKPIPWTGGMVVGTSSVAPVMVPAANPGICPSLCMNPMHEHKGSNKNPWYRGHKRGGRGAEIFWSRRKPTLASHGHRYGAVDGPFRKKPEGSLEAARRLKKTRITTNPGHRRGHKTTMTLEEFARKVKATKNPKLWSDFLAKIRGYKKWSHGTLPKKVTVETVDGAPGMKGIMLTYDAGKAPESTYIMPGGTKRKGAWKHPWSKMPSIKHDPEAGLVIHKVGRGQVSDFYHK